VFKEKKNKEKTALHYDYSLYVLFSSIYTVSRLFADDLKGVFINIFIFFVSSLQTNASLLHGGGVSDQHRHFPADAILYIV